MGRNPRRLVLKKLNRICLLIYRFTFACEAVFLYCGGNVQWIESEGLQGRVIRTLLLSVVEVMYYLTKMKGGYIIWKLKT